MELGSQWLGQTVDGRFPLLQYLAGDEQSAVFLTQLNDREKSKAAIKLVLASACDADTQIANWRRASKLSHPHLIRIFECGRCWLSGKELLYVISEYADETLAQVLPTRALTTSEADAMLRPTIEALNYLHGQGLVHGHIHPGNIMAVYDQLKLSSDGIQAAGIGSARADANVYDAPELARGQISPAADVWSLGVALAQSLTQNLPQRAEDIDYSKLPQRFAEIVRGCVSKNPSSRWTLRDIAAAIQLDLPEIKHEVSLVSTGESALSEQPKRLSTPVMLALAAVAVIVVALVIFNVARRGSGPAQETQAVSEETSRPPASAPAAPVQPHAINSTAAVLRRVLPEPSASANRTIHGRIKVRVRVNADTSGNVTEGRFVSPGPSKYFARLAMQAAEQWKFTPPTVDGQPSGSEWNLFFEFTRGGVQAFSQEVSLK